MNGPCLCGDPYCSSCGPRQGYYKCQHGSIQGECEQLCYNNPSRIKRIFWRIILGSWREGRQIKAGNEEEYNYWLSTIEDSEFEEHLKTLESDKERRTAIQVRERLRD